MRDELDQDTIMFIARRITGLPFLLSYDEGFGDPKLSATAALINAGKASEAETMLSKLKDESAIRTILELAAWYIYQPGTVKADLVSGYQFIKSGLNLTSNTTGSRYHNEFLILQGIYYLQNGNIAECKQLFLNIVESSIHAGDDYTTARAYQQLGTMSPDDDKLSLSYFQKALLIYQKLKIREKEMEVLWNITQCHSKYSDQEKDLRVIMALQKSSGFKHTLFVQQALSRVLKLQLIYLDALRYADSAYDNLKWCGMNALAGNFLNRIGSANLSLGKEEETLYYYKLGFRTRSKENQYFWFTSFFNTAYFLRDMGKPQEALSLIRNITAEYPPIGLWQKLLLIFVKGACYETLHENKLADQTYFPVLQLTVGYPDKNLALADMCWRIAKFYISIENLKKARLFIAKASENKSSDIISLQQKYSLLYKVDSLEGNYKKALEDHIKFKEFEDTVTRNDQRKKLDELTVQYDARKKDQDIRILKQSGVVQQAELKQNKLVRNIVIAGAFILLMFLGLVFNRYLLKQKSNQQLQNLVIEKEFLMKEIHHRVKNNLQIVISLLNTQSKFLNNEEAIAAISESRHRMQAMSLIHQKLYQSEKVAFVPMPAYIRELVDYLGVSFNLRQKIKFELNIDKIDLDISQAIPVGLILNEAVTNCIKHAFTDQPNGTIRVRLCKMPDGMILLEISDNGKGLPADFDFVTSQSLGIRLIRGLIEQIGGVLNFSDQDGCRIETTFEQDLVLRPIAV